MSKVKPLDEFALPLSLNTTPVFGPGIVILPEILPEILPLIVAPLILPVAVILPKISIPDVETTITFAIGTLLLALLAILKVTLPFWYTLTVELPLDNLSLEDAVTPVNPAPLPVI